jgi:hypothetical protein
MPLKMPVHIYSNAASSCTVPPKPFAFPKFSVRDQGKPKQFATRSQVADTQNPEQGINRHSSATETAFQIQLHANKKQIFRT